MASVFAEIIACFSAFASTLSNLQVVPGVSLSSVIVALVLFGLIFNLLKPSLAVSLGESAGSSLGKKIKNRKKDSEN